MRPSSCLLSLTFLAAGVSAFYPYSGSHENDPGKSTTSEPQRRFMPYSFDGDVAEEEEREGEDDDGKGKRTAPNEKVSRKSTTSESERRFVPYSFDGDAAEEEEEDNDGVGERTVPTLDIKKGPSMVRRENEYSAEEGTEPTMGDSMAIHNDGQDYSYFSTVTVGSKGQKMWMLLDTGSSNTWVMASDCTTEACNSHNSFGKEDSDTLTSTDEDFSVTYGTGKVQGTVIEDTMSFAGFDLDFAFGSATKASKDFLNYPMDGILGLGLGAPDEGTSVIQVMKDEKLLDKNIIGVNLQRSADGTNDGQITFGDIDTSKYSGELTYADVAKGEDRWMIPVDDAIVDGTSIGFKSKKGLVDTGTSFFLMPGEDAKKLHGSIPGSSGSGERFSIPCSTDVSVEVVIAGTKFNIDPKDYVGDNDGSGNCYSNIVGHKPFGDNEWLLGDVFLKNVYTVFDYDEQQIGFGKREYGASPSSSDGVFNPSATSTPPATGTSTSSGTGGITVSPMVPESSDSSSPEDEEEGGGEDGAAAGLVVPLAFSVIPFLATCVSWLVGVF